MDVFLIILLVLYIIAIILSFIIDEKQQKLIQDILDMNKKLIIERGKIIEILINTKLTETNSLKTLEKIEKVLKGDE